MPKSTSPDHRPLFAPAVTLTGTAHAAAILARGQRSFKVWPQSCLSDNGYWMVAPACLHRTGTGCLSRICHLGAAIGAYRHRRACREICDLFDIYTIIFLPLAVFIFLRLRGV